MRIFWAGVVLVVGLGGLAYWGANDHAERVETEVRLAAEGVVTGAIHPMEVAVSGRDITLTGLADTDAERDAMVASLMAVEGRRVVRAPEVNVLSRAEPYDTAIAKGGDGSFALTGHAPSAAAAHALEQDGLSGASALPLASGAPEGWALALLTGQQSLMELTEGSFALAGKSAILSGKAQTPADARSAAATLEALPDDYEKIVAIDVLDPGIVAFDLTYDAGLGLSGSGTVPNIVGPDGVALALGFDGVAGSMRPTYGGFVDLTPRLEALSALLRHFNTLSLRGENDTISAQGEALPGLDVDLLTTALQEALATDAVTVLPGIAPEDGTTRTNMATGRTEIASRGFWLAQPAIDVNRGTCNAEAQVILAGRSIQFVTGSAELDRVSNAILNDMAGLLTLCTRPVGMQVAIGGHTDSEGDELANYRLSVERANAVRDALILRGIPGAKLQAIGHGDTEPVADNKTPEGRAANRRTTFTW